jgi:O-methyltransferase/aklanonic acid methyltransferase
MADIILDKRMNEQLWDAASSSYGRVGPNYFTQCGMHLVDSLPIAPGMRMLDIATGTGSVLIPAAQRVGPNGHITGTDLSGEMIQEATRTASVSGLSNVNLLKMDAEHLNFPDASFDAVTCGFGIFFCSDMGAAFREMHRVCKLGGFIGITVFDKAPAPFTPGFPLFKQQGIAYKISLATTPRGISWTPEEMKGMLEQYGFRSTLTRSELHDLVYPNVEEWWKFLLTLGTRFAIMTMDEKTRVRFKDEYCAKLQALAKPDGLHITTAVKNSSR